MLIEPRQKHLIVHEEQYALLTKMRISNFNLESNNFVAPPTNKRTGLELQMINIIEIFRTKIS